MTQGARVRTLGAPSADAVLNRKWHPFALWVLQRPVLSTTKTVWYSAKSSTTTRVRCLSGSDMYTARQGMQEGITFGLPGASWSGRWIGHTPTIQQEEAGWTAGSWRFSKATCIDSGGYGQVFKNMAGAWDWEDVGLISRLGEVEISKSDAEMYIMFSIVRQGIFGWWWLMHISRDETWWKMLCLGIGVWMSL